MFGFFLKIFFFSVFSTLFTLLHRSPTLIHIPYSPLDFMCSVMFFCGCVTRTESVISSKVTTLLTFIVSEANLKFHKLICYLFIDGFRMIFCFSLVWLQLARCHMLPAASLSMSFLHQASLLYFLYKVHGLYNHATQWSTPGLFCKICLLLECS